MAGRYHRGLQNFTRDRLPECAAFGAASANHIYGPAHLRRILAAGVSPLEPGCPTYRP
jgi:hypothetical protein